MGKCMKKQIFKIMWANTVFMTYYMCTENYLSNLYHWKIGWQKNRTFVSLCLLRKKSELYHTMKVWFVENDVVMKKKSLFFGSSCFRTYIGFMPDVTRTTMQLMFRKQADLVLLMRSSWSFKLQLWKCRILIRWFHNFKIVESVNLLKKYQQLFCSILNVFTTRF